MAEKINKLAVYAFKGKNSQGQILKSDVQAASIAQARFILKKEGITVYKIYKKRKSFFTKRQQKIRSQDITFFTRQLATMLSAGIPLVQAFDIITKGYSHPTLQQLVHKIKVDVEEGHTFVEALKKYPQYFNELYVSLVAAGEQSGALDNILEKLAMQREKNESIRAKIKKALFYPAAVVVVAFVVCAILLIFVVPQFEELFKGFGAELPVFTRLVIDLSRLTQSYGWIMIFFLSSGIYALWQAYVRLPKIRYGIEKNALRIPIIGDLLKKAAIARFARILAISFAAGVPLVEALKAVSKATGNIVYVDATRQIGFDISQGQPLHLAIKKTDLFPEMVVQMVMIGEESGELEQMLLKIADYHEEQVDNLVESLSSLIEPFIIAILGILVGGLVVAMYLPIFKLGSVV